MGRGVVQNAMQGYNAALFAYGQTGSGKSYTMVGYGSNKGLVPMTCEELLRPVRENKDNETQYQVTFSMLEIYNEQVRDLQIPFRKRQHEGLKIRQHPKSGFYVEGLRVGFQAMTWERLACLISCINIVLYFISDQITFDFSFVRDVCCDLSYFYVKN